MEKGSGVVNNLLKNSSIGVIVLNKDGIIISINSRALNLFKIKNKLEIINRKIFNVNPFKNTKLINEFKKGLNGKSFGTEEIALRLSNSEEFVAKYIGIPFGNSISHGELVIFIEDFTEFSKSQKLLKSSEEKFRLLAEDSPNMVFIVQGNKVVYANKKCEEITGYKKEHLYSTKFDMNSIIASSSKEAINPLSSLTMNKHFEMTPDLKPCEYELITKDKQKKWVIMSFNIIQYDGKAATMGLITDITERKKAEEKIKRANEELKKIDKLKDELINVVAHELKTPLIPILGYASLILKDKKNLNKTTKEQLDIILKNAKRLEQAIKNILDMSRIDSGVMRLNLEEIDIAKIARDVLDAMKPIAKQANLKLIGKISKVPCTIADMDKISRVITNLVSNSLKYTPKGYVKLIVGKEGNNIVVRVKDTGMGIKENDKVKLFKKFSQLNYNAGRLEKGTGLGLAICKGIIERHKGEISVTSVYGKGSEFKFTIPIKKKGLNKR